MLAQPWRATLRALDLYVLTCASTSAGQEACPLFPQTFWHCHTKEGPLYWDLLLCSTNYFLSLFLRVDGTFPFSISTDVHKMLVSWAWECDGGSLACFHVVRARTCGEEQRGSP